MGDVAVVGPRLPHDAGLVAPTGEAHGTLRLRDLHRGPSDATAGTGLQSVATLSLREPVGMIRSQLTGHVVDLPERMSRSLLKSLRVVVPVVMLQRASACQYRRWV